MVGGGEEDAEGEDEDGFDSVVVSDADDEAESEDEDEAVDAEGYGPL